MKFVMWCLRPAIKRIQHLLRNSLEVKEALLRLRLPKDATFIKLDIKDYYLSGEHQEFIEASVQCVEVAWQSLYREVLTYLLDNQYVEDTVGQSVTKHFRVVLGAGMGVPYAGDLCDITFWFLAERNFVDNKIVLNKFSIYSYHRFRDDVLIIAGGTALSRQRFLQVLGLKAKF